MPYLPPDFEPGLDMFLVEGETDTMALWQHAPEEARKQIVGLSGTGSWGSAVRGRDKAGKVVRPDRLEELFGKARRVFVIFDNDDPYKSEDAAKSVERAWLEIKSDLGRKAKRVLLPQGQNDVCEFLLQYDWAALRVLLKRSLDPVRHYRGLDLSKTPPPTDWLVEDFLVAGETTVIAADSGTGKSWLTMQLALAVAGTDEHEFLGLKIRKHGTVVYVDEENPGDLVVQRLNALGMTAVHRERLDYLWYEGVDLRAEPEKLLEHCMEQEPVLIVLDSLSRIAPGVEENSNTEMSQLFRRGIIPLCRETGAAVVAVHHTSRAGNDVRGASAIRAATDQAIQMVAAESKQGVKTGNINLFPSKPRRQLTHLTVRIEGDMEKDGVVRVREQTEDTPY